MAEGYYTAFQDAVALAGRAPSSWLDMARGRFYAAVLAGQRALRLLKNGARHRAVPTAT